MSHFLSPAAVDVDVDVVVVVVVAAAAVVLVVVKRNKYSGSSFVCNQSRARGKKDTMQQHAIRYLRILVPNKKK